jgi:predicted SAM-dependent methyltransferase
MCPKRLHVGASSLELISRSCTSEFINESWIHLGDPPNFEGRSDTGTFKSRVRTILKRMLRRHGVSIEGDKYLYCKTEFRSWVFDLGDRLDLPDRSITFAYSEHVLEHFRFDVAIELFSEILRILEPGGVFRIVVPDSDYRIYEPPEQVGFPNVKLPMNHPNKHKVRWSKYLLCGTLELVGFNAIPVTWCDDSGLFHEPTFDHADRTRDPDLVSTVRYVQRPKSLIVDAIKRN